MVNKLIQITPTVFGVIVDDDAYDFEFIHNKTRIGYKVDYRLFKIDLPKGDFKIHGTCTLPNYDFDFEFNGFFHRIQLRLDIQKAISEAGLLLINPIDIKGQTFSNEHQNKWQESESKVIRGKLLIIEKFRIMKIQFEIEMPAMPNFLRFKKEAQRRQDGFKVNDGYPISNLTREEAEEFAESWKQAFIKHWEMKHLIK